MARSVEKLNLSWLLRHPLVATVILLALTFLLPFLRIGERLKLIPYWPLVKIESSVEQTAEDELDEDAKILLALRRAQELNAELSAQRDRLAAALRQSAVISKSSPAFAASAMPPGVAAAVISKGDSSNWRHSLVINRGTADGIREFMPVVVGRTLIGRVFMVADSHSVVQLITDPGFAVSCLIVDLDAPPVKPEERIRGLLRGDGSARPHFPLLEVEDVTTGSPVRPGLTVATSDFGGAFPLGLLVGEVDEAVPQAGYLQVKVRAAMNLDDIDVVTVLLHERPQIEQQALQVMKERK